MKVKGLGVSLGNCSTLEDVSLKGECPCVYCVKDAQCRSAVNECVVKEISDDNLLNIAFGLLLRGQSEAVPRFCSGSIFVCKA